LKWTETPLFDGRLLLLDLLLLIVDHSNHSRRKRRFKHVVDARIQPKPIPCGTARSSARTTPVCLWLWLLAFSRPRRAIWLPKSGTALLPHSSLPSHHSPARPNQTFSSPSSLLRHPTTTEDPLHPQPHSRYRSTLFYHPPTHLPIVPPPLPHTRALRPSRTMPNSDVARQWFVPGDGIDRHVIVTDIQRYLGNDATVRPGKGTGENTVGFARHRSQPRRAYHVPGCHRLLDQGLP
jgi:hypothetical protein